MSRNVLFLLPPGFSDNDRREFCPECAEIWGVLSYYPAIKEAIDIRYQPIYRPRLEMTGLFGEEHQNCPTLMLSDDADAGEVPIKKANGARLIDNARDIAKYFAHRYGTAFPRGS